MGALVILGTPPEQARRLPADLANRIVRAARSVRPDVQAFLDGGVDPDEAPLDANMTASEWRRQLQRGE